MKKTALILATLLTGASLFADEAAPASSYSVTLDVPYTTKYVFRGVSYADDALQPSVKFTTGDLYLGIWSSLPLDDGFEVEVDYYAGYGFKLSDALTLDAGVTVYHYPGLDVPGADKSTFEGYLGLNGSVQGVTLGAYVYNDFTLEAVTVQGNIGYSVPVTETLSMNLSGSLGHVSPDAGDDYTYYSFGVQLPFKLTDRATLTIGGNWASHDLDGVEDDHVWGNVGVTYTF